MVCAQQCIKQADCRHFAFGTASSKWQSVCLTFGGGASTCSLKGDNYDLYKTSDNAASLLDGDTCGASAEQTQCESALPLLEVVQGRCELSDPQPSDIPVGVSASFFASGTCGWFHRSGTEAWLGIKDLSSTATCADAIKKRPSECNQNFFNYRKGDGNCGCIEELNIDCASGRPTQLKARGKCLDTGSSGLSNGQKPHLWDCHGGGNQQWIFDATTGQLKAHGGKCLDTDSSSPLNGQLLHLWDCHGRGASNLANQQWTFDERADVQVMRLHDIGAHVSQCVTSPGWAEGQNYPQEEQCKIIVRTNGFRIQSLELANAGDRIAWVSNQYYNIRAKNGVKEGAYLTVGTQKNPLQCIKGCNACGYNWYLRHCEFSEDGYSEKTKACRRGKDWDCKCCGGSQSEQETCRHVCTSPDLSGNKISLKSETGGDLLLKEYTREQPFLLHQEEIMGRLGHHIRLKVHTATGSAEPKVLAVEATGRFLSPTLSNSAEKDNSKLWWKMMPSSSGNTVYIKNEYWEQKSKHKCKVTLCTSEDGFSSDKKGKKCDWTYSNGNAVSAHFAAVPVGPATGSPTAGAGSFPDNAILRYKVIGHQSCRARFFQDEFKGWVMEKGPGEGSFESYQRGSNGLSSLRVGVPHMLSKSVRQSSWHAEQVFMAAWDDDSGNAEWIMSAADSNDVKVGFRQGPSEAFDPNSATSAVTIHEGGEVMFTAQGKGHGRGFRFCV